jgi:hypothetical protein
MSNQRPKRSNNKYEKDYTKEPTPSPTPEEDKKLSTSANNPPSPETPPPHQLSSYEIQRLKRIHHNHGWFLILGLRDEVATPVEPKIAAAAARGHRSLSPQPAPNGDKELACQLQAEEGSDGTEEAYVTSESEDERKPPVKKPRTHSDGKKTTAPLKKSESDTSDDDSSDDDDIPEKAGIGVVKEGKATRQEKGKKLDDQWMQMFEKLKCYQKKHGKFPPSNTNDKNKSVRELGVWMLHNRQQKRLGDERRVLLISIGFSFDLHREGWMKNYEALKEFFEP